MEQLTEMQALKLVDYLRENWCFEDNGSSRAVFNIEGYAVKIACEEQGLLQNYIEKELYEKSESECLNPIRYYYDDLILVCDWVEVLAPDAVKTAAEYDFQDFLSYVEDYTPCGFEDYNEDALYHIWSDIREVVDFLSEEQGDSSDNYQLGINGDGNGYGEYNIVAYDYGYDTNYDNQQVVGNMEEFCPWKFDSRFFNRLESYFANGDESCWGDRNDWEVEEEDEDDEW